MLWRDSLEEHMKDCGEFRKETRSGIAALGAEMRLTFDKIREQRELMHLENRAAIAALSEKITQTKLWAMTGVIVALAAVVSALLGALAWVVAHGMPWHS